MPIINVEQGEVYEFTTVGGTSTVIAQFAGTSDVFTKVVYGITSYSGSAAQLILLDDAVITLRGQTQFIQTPVSFVQKSVFTGTTPKTSSYETKENFLVTGSFIRTQGSNDYLIKFAQPPNMGSAARPRVEIVRESDDTAKITVSQSAAELFGPFYFNGTETLSGSFSCTDPFCSIQITAQSNRWVVTNAIGNWTSP